MAKQTGIVSNMYVDDAHISPDVSTVSASLSRAQLVVTGIDKDHQERLPGIADARLAFNGWFDPTGAHAEFSGMGTAAKVATVTFGTAVASPAVSIVGAEVQYGTERGVDGSLAINAEAVAHISGGGLEWGTLHTTGGRETFASAGSATASVDGGTATSTGAAAYLHLFSIGSGTATFAVYDSADDSSFSAVTGLAFTAASAGTAQRVETAGTATLRRYTKVVATGTFGTAVVAVNVIRGI